MIRVLSREMSDWNWLIGSATAILALATIGLMAFTWLLRNETRRSRMPRVVARLDLFAGNYGEIQIINAGNGAAHDVTVAIDSAQHRRRDWQTPLMMPGEIANFPILIDDDDPQSVPRRMDQIAELVPSIALRISFEDIQRKRTTDLQTLDVAATWLAAKTSQQLAAYRGPLLPFYDLVKSASAALDRMATSD